MKIKEFNNVEKLLFPIKCNNGYLSAKIATSVLDSPGKPNHWNITQLSTNALNKVYNYWRTKCSIIEKQIEFSFYHFSSSPYLRVPIIDQHQLIIPPAIVPNTFYKSFTLQTERAIISTDWLKDIRRNKNSLSFIKLPVN